MFESARLKLTAWYLLIITLISILFSVAFYHASTREIERLINRLEFRQEFPGRPVPDRPFIFENPNLPSLGELEQSKRQLMLILLVINSGVIAVAGVAGYFLAGRTLRPIKEMIDEQHQFISNASHELRTPIATLRAEMEGSLLEKHISDKQARTLISSNLEELGTLQGLSNNLLQLAQVDNVGLEKSMQDLSILEVIKAAERKVKLLANKKQITLKTQSKEYLVIGDKASLIEALVILLDNAIKYSPAKTTIIISTIENSRTITIKVIDQGIGISEKDLPHIFERFYRADASRSKTEGYGLGLSIAKKIIEGHQGTISVQSKEKQGTTFSVTLPRATS